MENKISQLKMYWLTDSPLEPLILPEGYSYSHFSEKNRDLRCKFLFFLLYCKLAFYP